MSNMVYLHDQDKNGDIRVHSFNFPDGTRHIKFTAFSFDGELPESITLVATPKNNDDFMDILLASDALKRMGVQELHLVFPYVFGCRQDRVCVRGEPLSTRVYGNLINSCEFATVSIWDPHSDVISGLLNNCIVHPGIGTEVIDEHFLNKDNLVLICPDSGASKRVWSLSRKFQVPMVQCDKHRDMETGHILEFQVHGKMKEIQDKDLLIIDDCITNGGTFLGLKSVLMKLNPATVNLCVTHADHLTGLQNMCENFDTVFVSDSRDPWNWRPDNLTVIPIRV